MIDSVPPEARHVFVAVCGARAGKSYIFGALRLLHLALTSPLDTLAPGELASGLIVAPDLRLARQTLRYALGAANATKAMASGITAETSDSFVIRREAGRSVTLECLHACHERGQCGSRSQSRRRGARRERVLPRRELHRQRWRFVSRDRAAHYARGSNHHPDDAMGRGGFGLRALRGQSRRPADGSRGPHAHGAAVDDARTRSMVARETTRDPDNAAREFGAEFMTGGAGLFLDSAAVDSSVDEEIIL